MLLVFLNLPIVVFLSILPVKLFVRVSVLIEQANEIHSQMDQAIQPQQSNHEPTQLHPRPSKRIVETQIGGGLDSIDHSETD